MSLYLFIKAKSKIRTLVNSLSATTVFIKHICMLNSKSRLRLTMQCKFILFYVNGVLLLN